MEGLEIVYGHHSVFDHAFKKIFRHHEIAIANAITASIQYRRLDDMIRYIASNSDLMDNFVHFAYHLSAETLRRFISRFYQIMPPTTYRYQQFAGVMEATIPTNLNDVRAAMRYRLLTATYASFPQVAAGLTNMVNKNRLLYYAIADIIGPNNKKTIVFDVKTTAAANIVQYMMIILINDGFYTLRDDNSFATRFFKILQVLPDNVVRIITRTVNFTAVDFGNEMLHRMWFYFGAPQ